MHLNPNTARCQMVLFCLLHRNFHWRLFEQIWTILNIDKYTIHKVHKCVHQPIIWISICICAAENLDLRETTSAVNVLLLLVPLSYLFCFVLFYLFWVSYTDRVRKEQFKPDQKHNWTKQNKNSHTPIDCSKRLRIICWIELAIYFKLSDVIHLCNEEAIW